MPRRVHAPTTTRRNLLGLSLGVLGTSLVGCSPSSSPAGQPGATATRSPSPAASPAGTGGILAATTVSSLRDLETRTSHRIGVGVRDLRTGAGVGYRQSERFAMASTYKVLAVGCLLAQVSDLGQVVRYRRSELTAYSPLTGKHVAEGMSLRDLCAAAVEVSDNTAANLVLRRVGGPRQVTGFVRRELDDPVSRLDRYEPDVNGNGPGEQRDTSTPEALAAGYARLVGPDVLPPDRRALLLGWLQRCRTGLTQIRAAVPPGWSVGDKTGHADHGVGNDVAVLWRPGNSPALCVSVLTTATARGASEDPDLVRQVAALVLPAVL